MGRSSVHAPAYALWRLALQVGDNATLQLHVWCPSQPQPYPDTAPLFALSCSEIPGCVLLQLTAKLAAIAHNLVGDPVVHELAVQLTEELQGISGQADHMSSDWPAPFNQPLPSSLVSGSDAPDQPSAASDGYTDEAQQHAAAAEAIMSGDSTGVTAAQQVPQQRKQQHRTGLSREQAAQESRRLQEHYNKLQVRRS